MWIFLKEPRDSAYKELIDLAAELCPEFILVRRESYGKSENIQALLKELSIHLIEINKQQSWPGTTLSNAYANVHYYKLNDITKEVLKKYSSGLYSWIEPTLLEDLCFLKEGRKPWVGSVAHEKESWVENATNEEVIKLKAINGIQLKEIQVNM